MTVLLHGATLIDGTGGDPRPAMTVVVEGNRVVETHPSGGPAERQDAVCLDLDGLTVLPGVIDAHAHFGLVEFAPPGTTPAAVLAARIFRNCELALDAGFTTVRDTGGIDGGVPWSSPSSAPSATHACHSPPGPPFAAVLHLTRYDAKVVLIARPDRRHACASLTSRSQAPAGVSAR